MNCDHRAKIWSDGGQVKNQFKNCTIYKQFGRISCEDSLQYSFVQVDFLTKADHRKVTIRKDNHRNIDWNDILEIYTLLI